MVLDSTEVDICDADPGHEVDAWVSGRLRHLVEIWRGDRSWSAAIRSGDVTVTGAEPVRRFVPRWFPPSRFAAVPRPEPSAVAG